MCTTVEQINEVPLWGTLKGGVGGCSSVTDGNGDDGEWQGDTFQLVVKGY